MTIEEFRHSASGPTLPADLPSALQALWWVRHGDWNRAHECAQQHEGDPDCDLVHAHLHRQEGDMANAAAWYRGAGRAAPDLPVPDEWTEIATELLTRG